MQQPTKGGRYRREKDGSLTRIDDAAIAAPAEISAPAEDKPAKSPSKRKLEK